MDFLTRLIVGALAVLVASYLLPGVEVDGALTAVLVAAVLSLLNAVVKPILVFLTIPITVLTLGIFLLFINAFIILLADRIVPGFHVSSFWTAFLFSIVLSLVMAILERLARRKEND
jgi:putative membrane protein